MARSKVVLLVVVWSAAAAVGLSVMFNYELTPATVASPRGVWPDASQLVRDHDLPTLLMFVHPQCPCSRASLAELDIFAADCGNRATIDIVFVKPAGFGEGWEQTDLFVAAQRIPGAHVSCDAKGVETARFAATTSGETLLYGRDGRLEFRGGLTPSRGHEGDNPGRSALTALINTGRSEVDRAPVYGCSLSNQCFSNRETDAP